MFREKRSPWITRLCEKVLDETHADIVAHFVQLLVDFDIIAIIITTELGDYCAVSESNKFRIDFVDSRSVSVLDCNDQSLTTFASGFLERR